MLAGVALAPAARVFGQTEPFAATNLAGNFTLITGAGSNVLLVTSSDGALLVDGGADARSPELMKFVAQQAKGAPVQVLFNTHWHWDHTGSNEAIGKAGAKIVAHEFTKQWLGTEIQVRWENNWAGKEYEPRPKAALPNHTFYNSEKMTFGKEQIDYAHMPQAHTDGDIYVFFPGPNILVAGDVISAGKYPIIDYSTDGWPGGMVQGQKALLAIANDNTKIIPGTGPVQTKAEVQALNQMCDTVRDRVLKLMKMGKGPKDIIAEGALKDLDPQWGNSDLFIEQTYKGLWGHVRELGGIV